MAGRGQESIEAWLNLHLLARRMPEGEDSRVLADAALARILPLVAELPQDLPFVGVHAPTKPSAAVIEPWIEQVEGRAARPRAARCSRRASSSGCSAWSGGSTSARPR